jgi:hypothetical protein
VAIVDTHAHPARGVHRTGMGVSAGALLRTMDEFAVATTVLLPPPFPEGHRGAYGLREIQQIVRDGAGRLVMAAGGESLNPMIQGTGPDAVSPRAERRFRDEAEAIVRSGAIAFGEIALEHLSSGRGAHPYESAPPDHPLLRLLADIAAQHAVVIDVHMEAVPQDMPSPRDGGGRNPAELRANLAAFERLLDHNRAANIVWAHAGWDLTGERTVPVMRGLLERHANLYMSVKIDAGGSRRTGPMDGSGVRDEWLQLLRGFPGRFVIGSDQFFVDDTGRLAHARAFVDALPPDLAALVGAENARRLYRLPVRSP